MAMSDRTEVLAQVNDELNRQDRLWGEQNHPDGTGDVLYESLATMQKGENERLVANGSLTWRAVLEEEFWEALAETDPSKLRTELIQVAAVATQWVEAIDRRN